VKQFSQFYYQLQFIPLFLCAFSPRIAAYPTLSSTLSQLYITYA